MEFYISELEGHVKVVRENKNYSMQRLDVLLITICGAGIYTSFELMKFVSTSKFLQIGEIRCINTYFKVTALLFTISIIVNFLSQWTAYKTTSSEIEYIKMVVLKAKGTEVDINKMLAFKDKSDFYNKITSKANITGMLVMIAALVCLIIFTWNLF